MSLQPADIAHILLALTILLIVAHSVGHLFVILRQPTVVGEILGGLLLGPTVLGFVAPGTTAQLFPTSGVTSSVLGMVYELGLLLLMFVSGHEVRAYRRTGERRTVLAVAAAGLVPPFLIGLAAVQFVHHHRFSGPAGTRLTFALVFGIAIAVTSIPVISRIMLDLGLLNTPFARVVLAVAVIEDVVLYVVLAIVLGLTQAQSATAFGLWSLFHSDSTGAAAAYTVIMSLTFFAIVLPFGGRMFQVLARSRANLLERRSPTGFRLTFLLAMVLCCVVLGINPIFGALTAGLCAAAGADGADEVEAARDRYSWDILKHFSLAFFVPLYFAGVGLRLDLVHHFNVLFFLVFLLLACTAKGACVWVGARLSGLNRGSSTDLAVALNARGGPGIVLATVTLSAGIINEDFFTILVLLSIVTSQIAGLWLQGRPLLSAPARQSGEDDASAAASSRQQPVRGA